MKLGVLFSGGKDSTYALYKAQQHHDVVCLLSLQSQNKDSFMLHTPNAHIVRQQATALQIPIIEQQTSGQETAELDDIQQVIQTAINKYHIQGIVTGAVGSTYQAVRIQRICHRLQLWCFNPLWQCDEVQLLQELLQHNFVIHICAVAAYPLDETLLGKKIDPEIIKQLVALQEKYDIHPAGEGGEFETIALDGPNFQQTILPTKTAITYSNHAGVWHIAQAKLQQKITKERRQ